MRPSIIKQDTIYLFVFSFVFLHIMPPPLPHPPLRTRRARTMSILLTILCPVLISVHSTLEAPKYLSNAWMKGE